MAQSSQSRLGWLAPGILPSLPSPRVKLQAHATMSSGLENMGSGGQSQGLLLAWCLSFFFCCCDKIPLCKQLKGRCYFSSQFQVQSIITGKSRQQEPEAAGLITSIARTRD